MASIISNSDDNDDMYMSESEIDNLEFEEGLNKLTDRNLLLNSIEDLDDIREILKLKYHSIKIVADNHCNETSLYASYAKIMNHIKNLVIEIKKFIHSPDFQKEFKNIYEISEVTINGKQLMELERLVEMDSFPILTAGEAKAGKSTFINMLLGNDILPMNVITCTTAICEIKKSEQKKVTFYLNNEIRNMINLDLDKLSKEQTEMELDKLSEDIKLNMEKSDKVIFEYPVDFLNNYTYLVDSPGIGDNEVLQNITFNYLESKTPAFIFVLNSTNSDGLNLKAKNLIAEARQQLENQSHLLTNFDDEDYGLQQMEKAVFILNHWDVIKKNARDEQEVEDVRRKIVDVIQNLWHKSANENENIFFLSSVQAKDWIRHGIVKTEVVRIRNCLMELVGRLYRRNLENSFFLLKQILQKIESIILIQLNSVVDNKYNLLYNKNNAEDLCKLMENLVSEMPNRKQEIHAELQPKIMEMVKNLTVYLKSPEIEKRMLNIQRPAIGINDNVNILTMIMKKYLMEELEKAIKDWNLRRNEIDQLTEYLESLFEKHLKQIGSGISIQNGLLERDTLLTAWNSNSFRNVQDTDSAIISKIETVFIFGAITLLLPVVALAGLLAAPLIINHMRTCNKTNKAKLEEYQNNPNQYFNNFIKKTLDQLSEDDVKRCFFKTVYKRCEERIEAFETFITNEIREKRQTIENIDKETRNIPVILKIYNKLFVEIECIFGKYHQLRQKWFPDTSLKIEMDHYFPKDCHYPNITNIIAVGQYSMLFTSSDQLVSNVVFKSYTKKFVDQFSRFQRQEIDFLNKTFDLTLKCKSYCYNEKENQIYGVFENNFDMNLQLYLQQYPELITKNHTPYDAKWYKSILFVLDVSIQISTALKYLHKQKCRLVHPDLRLGTILVSKQAVPEKVNIYIYDACSNLFHQPKKTGSKLKEAPEQYFDMGGYTKANIFQLGSLIYKMCYFKEEKLTRSKSGTNLGLIFDATLQNSIDLVEEDVNIEWSHQQHKSTPEELNELIKKCVAVTPQNRPNINDCIVTLEEIKLMLSDREV